VMGFRHSSDIDVVDSMVTEYNVDCLLCIMTDYILERAGSDCLCLLCVRKGRTAESRLTTVGGSVLELWTSTYTAQRVRRPESLGTGCAWAVKQSTAKWDCL